MFKKILPLLFIILITMVSASDQKDDHPRPGQSAVTQALNYFIGLAGHVANDLHEFTHNPTLCLRPLAAAAFTLGMEYCVYDEMVLPTLSFANYIAHVNTSESFDTLWDKAWAHHWPLLLMAVYGKSMWCGAHIGTHLALSVGDYMQWSKATRMGVGYIIARVTGEMVRGHTSS